MQPHDDLSDHALAVIDQTLAGEPVAPEDAELAELTLILAGQRPRMSPAAAAALDARVQRRFAPEPLRAGVAHGGSAAGSAARLRPRRWMLAPGLSGLAGLAVALVIVLGGGSPSRSVEALNGPVRQPPSVASTSSVAAASAPAHGSASAGASAGAAATSASSAASTSSGAAASSAGPASPPNSSRQVIQGAQLALSTAPSHIEDVARQVFSVVADENGVVESSDVTSTSGPGGGASFSLTVPSANLGDAMAALSHLRGASVLSRNDVSQDVTGPVGGAGRRLADARALRTALLRKLALATTTTAIDSLHIQIRDANASIASDLATLDKLKGQVANSHIELTINAVTPVYQPRPSHGGGFTIGRAVHDAGRVLVVAAGVTLIGLAVLLPLGVIVAAGLWMAHLVRQRRREHALDLV